MAKTPEDGRLELLQGTLDMLILRTLRWGPKFYHLTPEGKKQLLREESRWAQLVKAIGLVMKPSTPGEDR